MSKIKEKVYDWKDRLKDRHMLSLVVGLIAIIVGLGIFTYKKQIEYRQASENDYNMAFYELVDYVDDVENYLAKSLISSTPQYEAENLSYVWREANLAQSYLARLPIESNELANTAKFLNQVSDYSFTLSRKNIYNEPLTEEERNNLKELHTYSVELKNTLNQLSTDINDGKISWGELTKKGTNVFAQQVSNISKDSFSNLEENFHEYAGLIYDGAFSEHMTNPERKGLTGEVTIPADKSISHRAIMFSALANGKSIIRNFSKGQDPHSTIRIFKELGTDITFQDETTLTIKSNGKLNIPKIFSIN